MTIRVDITHVAVIKLDKTLEPDALFVEVDGQDVQELAPGCSGTFYVHGTQDIRVFYDRRSKGRRERRSRVEIPL